MLTIYCYEKSVNLKILQKNLLLLHEVMDPKLVVIPNTAELHYNFFPLRFLIKTIADIISTLGYLVSADTVLS